MESTFDLFFFFQAEDGIRDYKVTGVQTCALPISDQVSEVMRRAFNLLRMGRPGPVMVEIPADVATAEAGDVALAYRPVTATCSAGNPRAIAAAAAVLAGSPRPLIHAGPGGLYARATAEH